MRAGVASEPAPAVWGQAGLKGLASASPLQPFHGFLKLDPDIQSLFGEATPFPLPCTPGAVHLISHPLNSADMICAALSIVLQTLSAFFWVNKDSCVLVASGPVKCTQSSAD